MEGIVVRAISAALAVWIAGPVMAIPTDGTPVSAADPYVHKPSGLSLPANLQGLPRINVKSWEQDQLDEGINYVSADGGENITIYIFRHVTGDASLWFDRIAWYIEHRDIYGGPTPAGPAIAFTPPGQSTTSALMQTYRTGAGSFRSTGAAIVPLGADWFVSARYSSRAHDAAALAMRFGEVVAAMTWPTGLAVQPAAAVIGDCPAPLTFAKKAKPAKVDSSAALMNAFLALDIAKELPAEKTTATPVVWCRDPGFTPTAEVAMYRADAAVDGYLLALMDSGRAISVGPDAGTVLMGGKQRWNITHVEMRENRQLPPVDRLPAPPQVFEIVNQGHYLSTTSTWGDRTININPDTMKR